MTTIEELRAKLKETQAQIAEAQQPPPATSTPPPNGSTFNGKVAIENLINATITDVKQFAGQKHYTPQHIAEQNKTRIQDALASLAELRETGKAQLAEKRAQMEKQAYLSPAPPAEVVTQMGYIQQTLQRQWSQMKPHQITQAWQKAVEHGDTLTAQVYRDFAPGNARIGNQRLIDATDAMLRTPEQQTALDWLAQLPQVEIEFEVACGTAKRTLEHTGLLTGEEVVPRPLF